MRAGRNQEVWITNIQIIIWGNELLPAIKAGQFLNTALPWLEIRITFW